MNDEFYIIMVLIFAWFVGFMGFCHGPNEAQAREQCSRPPYMMDTVHSNCGRVPTLEKPYCPFPN